MNSLKITASALIALFSINNLFAECQIKWDASAGETKKIFKIEGEFLINWGDGSSSSSLAHTYAKGGEYTATISGATSVDLRGDDKSTGECGIKSFIVNKHDTKLSTLNIWGNSLLEEINVSEATSLKEINTTACPKLSFLDLSNNANLSKIDIKLCSGLSEVSFAENYNSLTYIDVNNSALSACSLNSLFNALPQSGGNIYTAGCSGDKTSNPQIAKNKGWKFINGGIGDGSAICAKKLLPATNIKTNISAESIKIEWEGCESAEKYSVKIMCNEDDECSATGLIESATEYVQIKNEADLTSCSFYIYSINGIDFKKAGPFYFSETKAEKIRDNKIYTILAKKDYIEIKNLINNNVRILNFSGQCVKNLKAQNGDIKIKLDKGEYVIMINENSHKVQLR